MQINEFIENIITYIGLGVLWLFILTNIESRESSRSGKHRLPSSIKAKAVIILTWPVTAFITIVSMLRKLTS